MHRTHQPPQVPTSRILGPVTDERRRMLAGIDVIVGYTSALYRLEAAGWQIDAALTETRTGWRGGETVALRVRPLDPAAPHARRPLDMMALQEIAWRIADSIDGVRAVVPDTPTVAPDVDGTNVRVAPGETVITGLPFGFDDAVNAC